MFPRPLPPHPELPFPPAGNLNGHFILGEIRDYIKDFKELFPHVDLDILFDQITAVRRKNVNAETQMRQFLLAFRNTETFQKALEQLDEDTRKKIEAFRDGASCGDVVKAGGFQLPPSPQTKLHFRLLNKINAFFHRSHKLPQVEAKKQPLGRVEVVADPDGVKAPIIYEDADDKKIMKVWNRSIDLIQV